MSDAKTMGVRFPNVRIHESSYVDEPAQIGEGTSIWHFCHILGEVTIGRRCSIGQNVVIGPRVTVGDNCKIQNNVSLYEGVTLEDDVFCGPSCVFTNVVNPRSAVSRKSEFRPTLVKCGATIGANATIVCGHTIGSYAFIAAGAVVTTNMKQVFYMVQRQAMTGFASLYGLAGGGWEEGAKTYADYINATKIKCKD